MLSTFSFPIFEILKVDPLILPYPPSIESFLSSLRHLRIQLHQGYGCFLRNSGILMRIFFSGRRMNSFDRPIDGRFGLAGCAFGGDSLLLPRKSH